MFWALKHVLCCLYCNITSPSNSASSSLTFVNLCNKYDQHESYQSENIVKTVQDLAPSMVFIQNLCSIINNSWHIKRFSCCKLLCLWWPEDEKLIGDQRHWGQMWPTSTYFPITAFIKYSLSSLVFLCSPSTSSSFLLSTCHHDDIGLYLWEERGWRAIPKGLNDSQLHLVLTDIFTFKVLPSCLCLNTGRRAPRGSNRPTCYRRPAHVLMSSLLWLCPPFDQTKESLCRAIENEAWASMPFKCSIPLPFQQCR